MKILRIDHRYWLLAIFILAFGFRLFFVFQAETFSQDSYFAVRQVENILDTGAPVLVDDLSYAGRAYMASPIYYYILAGFSFFLGTTFALKILPALFFALFVMIAFLLARQLTSNIKVSLLIALFAAFIPSFFLDSLNSVSPVDLFLPMMFLCMYFFLKVPERLYLYLYVISTFFLAILSPLAFLFATGIIIFLLLMKLDYQKQSRLDMELGLFSIFLILWVEFLFYKKAFLFHGFSVVWQNIPVEIISNYFKEIAVIDVLYGIGLIPLFFGIFAVYRYVLKEKNRQVYFMVAFALSVALILWLRLIKLNTGLIFLGAVLVVLASLSFKLFFNYFEKTKAARLKTFLWLGVIAVFFLTSAVASASWAQDTMDSMPSKAKLDSLEWMAANLEDDDIILATPNEGFLVNSIAKKKNVADNNFLLIPDAEVIFEDIKKIYTTKFETQAVELLDKYGVDYIYFSDEARSTYDVDELAYVNDRCFPLILDGDYMIYEVRCHLKND